LSEVLFVRAWTLHPDAARKLRATSQPPAPTKRDEDTSDDEASAGTGAENPFAGSQKGSSHVSREPSAAAEGGKEANPLFEAEETFERPTKRQKRNRRKNAMNWSKFRVFTMDEAGPSPTKRVTGSALSCGGLWAGTTRHSAREPFVARL
jgi:hypothetical protein